MYAFLEKNQKIVIEDSRWSKLRWGPGKGHVEGWGLLGVKQQYITGSIHMLVLGHRSTKNVRMMIDDQN